MAATVRPAEVEDAPLVAAIYVELWNSGFSGLLPSRQLTDDMILRWKRALGAGHPSGW